MSTLADSANSPSVGWVALGEGGGDGWVALGEGGVWVAFGEGMGTIIESLRSYKLLS